MGIIPHGAVNNHGVLTAPNCSKGRIRQNVLPDQIFCAKEIKLRYSARMVLQKGVERLHLQMDGRQLWGFKNNLEGDGRHFRGSGEHTVVLVIDDSILGRKAVNQ